MPKVNQKIILLSTLFLMIQLFLPCTILANSNRIIFILDASGSMWGRINGKPKIVIARQVMKDLLNEAPSNIDMSLMAYGHRRKGDCKDIEMIGSTGTDPARLKATIDQITPRGMTPITDALSKAASVISKDGASGTVVLISDGLETCSGNPCALAKELVQKGVKIVVHTVGFDVDQQAARQLACIADATAGHYYAAGNSQKLHEILFSVTDAVVKQKAPPKPEVPVNTQPETKSKRIRITGFGTIILKPADWVKMPPYKWGVVDAESGQLKGEASTKKLKIKKGEYQIWWQQTEHNSNRIFLSEAIKVTSGNIDVPIDTGLRITVPKGISEPYRWWLSQNEADDIIANFHKTLDAQVVPAGRYHLHWWQDKHYSTSLDLGPVEIEAARLNDYVIDQGFLLRSITKEPFYFYKLLGTDGKMIGRWKGKPALQIAPPGTYTLVFRQTEHGHRDVFWGEVTVPDKGFPIIDIDSGVKFIVPAGTPLPYRVYFKNLENDQEIEWHGNFARTWSPILLPPGKYRLDWWEKEHETKRMTLIDEFTVEPSTIMEIEL